MEVKEIIKRRIALFGEIGLILVNNGCKSEHITAHTIAVFQEVCKDDRMNAIHRHTELQIGKAKGQYEPATEKQVKLMIKLKIPSGKYTKTEASALIEEALNPKKRSE